MRRILLLTLAVLLVCLTAPAQTCPPPSQGGPNPSYNSYWTVAFYPFTSVTGVYSVSGTTATIQIAGIYRTLPFAVGDKVSLNVAALSAFNDQGTGRFSTTVTTGSFLHGYTAYIAVKLPWAPPSEGFNTTTGWIYKSVATTPPMEPEITVDGQTTGNVSCMSGNQTPHTFAGSVQPAGGSVYSSSQAEPLTYSTDTFFFEVPMPIGGSIGTYDFIESVKCPMMGTILQILPIPQIQAAFERTKLTGSGYNCFDNDVGWFGATLIIENCYFAQIPQCSNVTPPATPDLNVGAIIYEVAENGYALTLPWGSDNEALEFSWTGHQPWTYLVTVHFAIGPSPLAFCTYHP